MSSSGPSVSDREALRTFYKTSAHYHEALQEREAASFQSEYWRMVQTYLPAGSCVLDLGCGTGYSSARLMQAGFDVTAMDISLRFLSHAHDRPSGRLHFAVGDAIELPFANASFDGVSTFCMIEHVVDIEKAFSEIRRVLRPGGRFVNICPNYWSPVIPLKALIHLLHKGYGFVSFYESVPEALYGIPETLWGTLRKLCRATPDFVYRKPQLEGHMDVDCDCVYLPSPVDFKRYFQRAGFKIIRYGGEGSSLFKKGCATIAPSLVPSVYFVAEKPSQS
ncbi:MAG: class I SAM-dependent methyltransferase [candidate division Zixibacteria bacterium]|nr:class I SAM-dependent methyltransferase [candidate division Zixibacteria bacterium]